MELIYQINLAYFILVTAITISVVAMVMPGTFFPEMISACLILAAAFFAYLLNANPASIIILLFSFGLLIYAVFISKKYWLVALSIAVLLLDSLFVYRLPGQVVSVNLWLALFMSVSCYGFLLFFSKKMIEIRSALRPLKATGIIGEKATLAEDFDRKGSLQIGGELWSVESTEFIAAGTEVAVIEQKGLTLMIQKLSEAETEK